MAIFGISVEKTTKTKKTEETDYSKVNNQINPDTEIEGHITSKANLKFRGKIKGNITSENIIFIEPQGEVIGNLKAPKIDIRGNVQGHINHNALINLHSNCKFVGNITCNQITISGNYNGTISAKKVIITESAIMKGTVITETISIAENPNLELEFKIKEKPKNNQNGTN